MTLWGRWFAVAALGLALSAPACSSDGHATQPTGTPDSATIAMPDGGTDSLCGNSVRDAGESCDDGNAAASDGCSSTCQSEPLYICTGTGPGSCVRRPAAWAQEAYVKASNPGELDKFGYSVALSRDGDVLAVGAFAESSYAVGINDDPNVGDAFETGAVYVFRRSGATWAQEAYVKASNTGEGDQFGRSVALSADGSTLAVGAPGERSNAIGINGDQDSDEAYQAGAVYVFHHARQTWVQEAYAKASNPDEYDVFGSSVALSADGNTLAVGAYREASSTTGINGNQADNSVTDSGATYVFKRSGATWAQEAYIKPSKTSGLAGFFGAPLSLSADGDTLAVAAAGESSSTTGINGNQVDTSAEDAGAVYIFKRDGSTWSQAAYIKASNTNAKDRFGSSVALSADGSMLAVGAPGESSAATGINGNQADNSAEGSGAVYIFEQRPSGWAQEAYIKASNANAGDEFGECVALSADGRTLAVGSPGESSSATGVNGNQTDNSATGAGALYLFKGNGSAWAQEAYIKASNSTAGDVFGGSAVLSADGTTLAVAAYLESSASAGTNGNQTNNSAVGAGAVYVFRP